MSKYKVRWAGKKENNFFIIMQPTGTTGNITLDFARKLFAIEIKNKKEVVHELGTFSSMAYMEYDAIKEIIADHKANKYSEIDVNDYDSIKTIIKEHEVILVLKNE